MKLITRDNFIEVCSLQAEPELDLEELLKPITALRVNVDDTFVTGIMRLSVALVDPYLKLTNTSRGWTIYQKDKYAIAEQAGDQFVVTPWVLESQDSFDRLKEELGSGKFLVAIQQDGYRVVARNEDIEHLVIEKDYNELWMQVCRSYLELQMLGIVRWSYQARRPSRLDFLIKDVALKFIPDSTNVEETTVPGECFTATSYFMDVIHEVLASQVKEMSDFVQHDLWAYYSVSASRTGITITRHHDARALIWNKNLIDAAQEAELEDEALTPWSTR